MKENDSCGYAPEVCKDGCILRKMLDSQAESGGLKISRSETQELREPAGPYWVKVSWDNFVRRIREMSRSYHCLESNSLKKTTRRLTEQKIEDSQFI